MSNEKTACLLMIGNEILSGRTQDKNLSYIGTKLNEHGIRMREARVIPDIESVIVETLNECRTRFDYIFTTGGIGPTHDDITSAAIAKAFDVPFIRNPEAEKLLRDYYRENINEPRLTMSDMPEGASLIPNPISTAPGFIIGNVYVMAGVPSICAAMIDWIIPQLKGGQPLLSRSIEIDAPEGNVAEKLTAIQAEFADIEIGIYPRIRDQKLCSNVVMRHPDDARLSECANALVNFLDHQALTWRRED